MNNFLHPSSFLTFIICTYFETLIKYSFIFFLNKNLNVKLLFRVKNIKKYYKTIFYKRAKCVLKNNVKNLVSKANNKLSQYIEASTQI